MAASIVLVPALLATGFQGSAGGRSESAVEKTLPRGVIGSHKAAMDAKPSPSVDPQLAYWKHKAQKRLRLLGARERRIVKLLTRLRARESNARNPGVHRAVSLAIPHYSAWLCIHRYEGAWNDSGDPYWGGLQMDRSFMQTYAPRWLLARGWANVWTPREQMWVAERAWRSRGFSPWPNTARACGLL